MPDLPRAELLDGSFHHHLLMDQARASAWVAAVRRVVRPGDVVADVGSGSGLLAWAAARAGARRVHAVEANTHSYRALLRNARENGVLGTVVPTLADGTQWRPPEPVDVVVCELMETGLLHEPIAAVARNVRAWEARPRAFLPQEVRLLVEGVEVRETFQGYRARFSGFRAPGEEDAAVTDLVPYATYRFRDEAPPEEIAAEVVLTARRDGRVGGLQLRTETLVAPDVALGASPAYCTPVTLALETPLAVAAGERLVARLRYEFSYTARPLSFDVARA